MHKGWIKVFRKKDFVVIKEKIVAEVATNDNIVEIFNEDPENLCFEFSGSTFIYIPYIHDTWYLGSSFLDGSCESIQIPRFTTNSLVWDRICSMLRATDNAFDKSVVIVGEFLKFYNDFLENHAHPNTCKYFVPRTTIDSTIIGILDSPWGVLHVHEYDRRIFEEGDDPYGYYWIE